MGAGCPVLTYFRRGSLADRSVVFVPGGSHLARIAYGHPGARREDFLDFWLERLGFGLIALSYPLEHPIFERVYPDLTVDEWGASAASVVKSLADEQGLGQRVIVAGWSMAGKVVRAFARHGATLGLSVDGFLSLAASPPIPGLAAPSPRLIRLTPDGLRDTTSPVEGVSLDELLWRGGLAEQNEIVGRTVIESRVYREEYRGNYPLQLRGEPERLVNGEIVRDWGAAIEDAGSFEFGDYPLTGMIVPSSQSDLRHALTDQAAWSLINAQTILAWLDGKPHPDRRDWMRLRALISALPHRLTRTMDGGHFFFVGEAGARTTATFMSELYDEICVVKSELAGMGAWSTSARGECYRPSGSGTDR
jgi:hypothetical protein